MHAVAEDHSVKTLVTISPEAHKELSALLGERYTVDRDDILAHAWDENSYHRETPPGFGVVYPQSTEEVSAIAKICYKHEVAMIPYGSGTSLEAHTSAPHGGIHLDMSEMNEVLAVHKDDLDVVVQPGITWNVLNDELKPYGLFLPVDPGPGASIGGMAACGCSGTNAVRYGTMKDSVINLTVVLADGRIIKTAQRARKSSAGYDLTRLFVGSEGTLGIVTETCLRLQNLPEKTSVARVTFDSVDAASASVIRLMQAGVRVQCVELLDEVMVKAVNKYSGRDLPLKPTIFFKFSGSAATVQDDIERTSRIVAANGGSGFHFAATDEEAASLWEARKGCLWASTQLRADEPAAQVWTTDVCVPISRLAQAITETKKDLSTSFLGKYAPVVGHVGDGNFHVLFVIDPNNKREMAEAKRLNDLMVKRAISLEGTCTGEHGVGRGKRKYLPLELGPTTVAVMRQLRLALDPKQLLNPGKVFLSPEEEARS